MKYKVVKTFTLNACGENFSTGDIVTMKYNNRVVTGRIKRLDDMYIGIESLDDHYFYGLYYLSILKKIKHYYPGIEKDF